METASLEGYIQRLCSALKNLPSQFYQISITGGEPMLSPYIRYILMAVYPFKDKYTNILLTTNGTNLTKDWIYEAVSLSVDHINISRHHWNDEANKAIFCGSYDVGDYDVHRAIDRYGKSGIDISANCVINDTTTRDFIEEYIEWARNIGFRAVRFRKENGTLDKTTVEKTYSDHKVVWEGRCPVCRTTLQFIHGYKVYWKSSTLEPSETISDSIFEVIFAPDAKLYDDWKFTKEIILREPQELKLHGNHITESSCGGSGCGGNRVTHSCGVPIQ